VGEPSDAIQPFLGLRFNLIEKGFEVRLDLPGIGSLINRTTKRFGFFSTSPI